MNHPMTTTRSSALRPKQVRLSHAFGPVCVTAVKRCDNETVIHAKTLDGAQALTLSARYCTRLPLIDHAAA